ncbi:MAG TPA: FAD-dependent oxidoreductase, partial [Ktedonobacteraceae bacterium]|nr:FAD-dependent oxidoreductase [Ktedonobacteraceae bacterium]
MADNVPVDKASQLRIAIVGAGIAGLNAALTLQDAGLTSTIYEASDYVGGRMHSDATTWAEGMVTDLCGEFIDSDHKTLHALIRRFGLATIDLGKATAPGAQNIMYLFNRYYSPGQVYQNFASIDAILQQQIKDCGFPTTYDHYTDTGYRLDHLSVYDWIESYVKGGHDVPLGRMLDGACSGFFGPPTREQSSLNLVYMFGSPDDDDEDNTPPASGPMMGSAKIAGGNQQLPLAIARSLPEGCIRLHHRLVSIRR